MNIDKINFISLYDQAIQKLPERGLLNGIWFAMNDWNEAGKQEIAGYELIEEIKNFNVIHEKFHDYIGKFQSVLNNELQGLSAKVAIAIYRSLEDLLNQRLQIEQMWEESNQKLVSKENSLFPHYFKMELDKSNAEKNVGAPLAILLHSDPEASPTFTTNSNHQHAAITHPLQAMIMQIAKTHRVMVKAIFDKNEIRQGVAEAEKTTGQRGDVLIIDAHGNTNHMKFKKGIYKTCHVAKEDFSHLSKNAKIILYSCKTGSLDSEWNLATMIATVSKRIVYAPTKTLVSTLTCLVENPDRTFAIRSFDRDQEIANNKDMICTFKEDGSFEPSDLFLKNEGSSFSSIIEYTIKHAEEGDLDAQITMGLLCEKQIAGLSIEEALKWHKLAADQGCLKAQLRLADLISQAYGQRPV